MYQKGSLQECNSLCVLLRNSVIMVLKLPSVMLLFLFLEHKKFAADSVSYVWRDLTLRKPKNCNRKYIM